MEKEKKNNNGILIFEGEYNWAISYRVFLSKSKRNFNIKNFKIMIFKSN